MMREAQCATNSRRHGAGHDVLRTHSEARGEDSPSRRPSRAALRFAAIEAAWFFQELGGKVPEDGDEATARAAARIEAWLGAIPTFHRGALALRYAPRAWPACIAQQFGPFASVVVRLECALHPARGVPTAALEAASVERLRRAIEWAGAAPAYAGLVDGELPAPMSKRELARLASRAKKHVELAVRALAHARGHGASVVPVQEAR